MVLITNVRVLIFKSNSTGSEVYSGYRERILPAYIMDINCTGEELSVWDCPHNAISNLDCRSYYQDAAVICAGMTTINVVIS